MPKVSAGILMYKFSENRIKVFLVHPGGPFWKNKDEKSWSIPKGEPNENEDLFDAARRELNEETGINPPKEKEKYVYLGKIKQNSGKIVHAWAFEGDFSGLLICKSYVSLEYPPKSNKIVKFPEVDKASFFPLEIAKVKIMPAQISLLEKLEEILKNKN